MVLALLALSGLIPAQARPDPWAGWTEEEVGQGVVLRMKALELQALPQTVAVLEVVKGRRYPRFAFVGDGRFDGLPALARPTRAIAAINGGFFDKKGRGVGMLRIGGEVFGDVHEHRTAAVVLDVGGRPSIETDTRGLWKGERNVMSAGPLLVSRGKVPPAAGGWSAARHPRTAIGTRKDGATLLVTIDGRTPESGGVSLAALAEFMRALGCLEALNLDGGGSTTMWVRGEPEGGIVNHPCDNRKHDHAGVRRIPNAVLVLAKDAIVQDDDEAVLEPAEGWERLTDGERIYGGAWRRTLAPGASARWTLPVDFPGKWELSVRCPRSSGLTTDARLRCGGSEARFDQSRCWGRWQNLLTVTVEDPGPLEVILSSADAHAFAVDGVRLVQLD